MASFSIIGRIQTPRSPLVAVPNLRKDLAFESPGALTDITFRVEGRELHFRKVFLRAVSPVFDRMFESDFKEKATRVLDLPKKKAEDVDLFLQNVHPQHAWKPLDDDALGILLKFSDEYQTQHIREKCQHYIDFYMICLEGKGPVPFRGIPDLPKSEIARKLVFYLCLCEEYELPKLKNRLIDRAATVPSKEMETDEFYKRLSEKSQNAIVRARCLALEKKNPYYAL